MPKLVFAAFATVALTPAAAVLFWPDREPFEIVRTVELNGPIAGFTQTPDRIQVRLTPARNENEKRARSGILIRDPTGDKVSIPLKRGQTWASVELPDTLASATDLEISVE